MRSKSVDFPEDVLTALAMYKQQTGISASDYIRNAVCRRLITDRIIKLKFITIDVDRNNGKSKPYLNLDAINSNSFCDGESCEIPVQLPTKSC